MVIYRSNNRNWTVVKFTCFWGNYVIPLMATLVIAVKMNLHAIMMYYRANQQFISQSIY